MFACRHCGAPVTLSEPVPRDAECAGCGRDLRACVHCRHYDPAMNNSCRETEAEPVTDKERRNFCEFFSFAPGPWQKADTSSMQAEARAKLEALFGGQTRKPSPAGDARARLEALFGGPPPAATDGEPAEADEPEPEQT
jgi:hypothetical protein